MEMSYCKGFSTPVCWNCDYAQVVKIVSDGDCITVFAPCNAYRTGDAYLCDYKPKEKAECYKCENFDISCGCLDGYSLGMNGCVFKPVDKPEGVIYSKIRCPLSKEPIHCLFLEGSPCSDCCIDWQKVPLVGKKEDNEFKDTRNHNCPECE